MVAKLAARFPNQTFDAYASLIVTKPLAIIFTCLYGIFYLLLSSYVVRNISGITKEYLLDQTPVEVIALVFLIPVLIYKINQKLHENGDPSWKKEEQKGQPR